MNVMQKEMKYHLQNGQCELAQEIKAEKDQLKLKHDLERVRQDQRVAAASAASSQASTGKMLKTSRTHATELKSHAPTSKRNKSGEIVKDDLSDDDVYTTSDSPLKKDNSKNQSKQLPQSGKKTSEQEDKKKRD